MAGLCPRLAFYIYGRLGVKGAWFALFLAAGPFFWGCGEDPGRVAPQTLQRARELTDRFDRARRQFYDADPGVQVERPNPAWLDDALILLDSPAGRSIPNTERLALSARIRMLKEDWDLAAEDLEALIAEAGETAEHLRGLALCRLKAGPVTWEKAEEAALRGVELDAGSAEGWWLAGKAAQALERPEVARERFARALELDPTYLPARLERAISATAAGAFEEASEVIREAGKKVRTFDTMVRLEFRRALVEAEKARKAPPESPESFAVAARVYYQAARFEDAIALARRALEANPADAETLGLYALTLVQTGRADEAVAACEKFIAQNPGHAAAEALLRQLRQAGNTSPNPEKGGAGMAPPALPGMP